MKYNIKPRVKRHEHPEYGPVYIRSLLLSERDELSKLEDGHTLTLRTVALALVDEQGNPVLNGPDDPDLAALPLDFVVFVANAVGEQNLGLDAAKKG